MLHDKERRRVYVRGVLVGAIENEDYLRIRERVRTDKSVKAKQLTNYFESIVYTGFEFFLVTAALWCWTVGAVILGYNRIEMQNFFQVSLSIKTSFAWALMLGIVLMICKVGFFGFGKYRNIFEHETSEEVKRAIGCASSDLAIITY